MNKFLQNFLQLAWLGCLLFSMQMASAADSLVWNTNKSRVDANIESWSLPTLLEKVSAVTRWEIYMEPGTTHEVSTKFSDLPVQEALQRLLGKLNYALVPQTNAPSKFLVFKTSLGEATQLIGKNENPNSDASNYLIPDELIVTLKPGCGTIDDIAKEFSATVIGRSPALNAYRLKFADAAAANDARAKFKAEECVASADSNYFFKRPPAPQNVSLSSLDTPALKPANKSNGQLVIGLIDSQVQSMGTEFDSYMLPGISVAGDGNINSSSLTHGTSMAQSILQAANCSNPRILPVNVYGENSKTTTYEVARGVYEAVNGGANIVNMSLGSPGDSPFLHSIIQKAHSQGVLFFAAAGNEPITTPTYPAAYPEVNGVTSIDRSGKVADYANRGSFVKLGAPSANIVKFNNNSYFVSGTSVSSALASGMAAGMAGCGDVSMNQIESTMRSNFGFKPGSP